MDRNATTQMDQINRQLGLILRHLMVLNAMVAVLIGWFILSPIFIALAGGLGWGQ